MPLPNLSALPLGPPTGPIFTYRREQDRKRLRSEAAKARANAPKCAITLYEPEDDEEVYKLPVECDNPPMYRIAELYQWLVQQERDGKPLTDPVSRVVIPPAEWEAIKEWMREHRPGSVVAPAPAPAPAPQQRTPDGLQDGGDDPFASMRVNGSSWTVSIAGSSARSKFNVALRISNNRYPWICQLFRSRFVLREEDPEAYNRLLMRDIPATDARDPTIDDGYERFRGNVVNVVRAFFENGTNLAQFTDALREAYGAISTASRAGLPLILFGADNSGNVTIELSHRNFSWETYWQLLPTWWMNEERPSDLPVLHYSLAARREVVRFVHMVSAILRIVSYLNLNGDSTPDAVREVEDLHARFYGVVGFDWSARSGRELEPGPTLFPDARVFEERIGSNGGAFLGTYALRTLGRGRN